MWKSFTFLSIMITILGCQTQNPFDEGVEFVHIPYIKNTSNECYYLDEFMPTPDALVAGKSGRMSLRYYTYKTASYKDWEKQHIILSFYSSDDRCWSLFEEYYIQ